MDGRAKADQRVSASRPGKLAVGAGRGEADPFVQLDGGAARNAKNIIVILVCEAVLQEGGAVDGIVAIDDPMEQQVGGVPKGIVPVAPVDVPAGLPVQAVVKVVEFIKDAVGDQR